MTDNQRRCVARRTRNQRMPALRRYQARACSALACSATPSWPAPGDHASCSSADSRVVRHASARASWPASPRPGQPATRPSRPAPPTGDDGAGTGRPRSRRRIDRDHRVVPTGLGLLASAYLPRPSGLGCWSRHQRWRAGHGSASASPRASSAHPDAATARSRAASVPSGPNQQRHRRDRLRPATRRR